MARRLMICGFLALAVRAAGAQTQGGAGRITGTVAAAETGQPLLGTTVSIPGTRFGAITRADGNYTIVGVLPGRYPVRAAMIGYSPVTDTVTVTAGGTATANFRLTRQALQLDAVVAVGYGTQRRRDVTGAVGSVQAQEIQQVPATNTVDAIKGRVPGVDVVSTGFKPGDAPRVRIRGQRSLFASNDPLYVLDGIPMAGGLNDINPTDIESVEVLKDASSTAIYGSRGANGVVLITTRKGSAGGTRITYDGYVGAQDPLRTVRMMNGDEFAQFKREAYRTVGKYKCPAGVLRCDAGDADLFFPAELAAIKAGTWTDWQNLILHRGLQSSNQLAVSGGNDRTQYAVSGNLVRQDGIVRGQDFGRRSMRVNVETQAHERLRFGASALVSRSEQNLGRGDAVYGEALANDPLGRARDSTGALIFKPVPDGQRVNPLSDVANYTDERARTRVFGTLFANLNLAKGLDWRVNFGPDLAFVRRGQFRGAQTQARQGSGADALIGEERTSAYTLDNIVTVKRDLGADHRVDATFLYSVQKERTENDTASVSGLPYEHQEFYNLGSGSTIEGVASRLREWTLQSYMTRLNYAFKDRYLLTLTGRLDGSSRLAPGNKYALFPSVALGWLVGDESFMRDLGLFETLKLRASYGRAGNTGVDPYQTQGALSRTAYSFGDAGAFGYRPGDLRNPSLRWEKTDQFDVGLEFGVLRGRVSGTVDYYRAMTHDLIMQRQLPATTGFSTILQNIGETRNTGVELGINTVPLRNWHGVRWSVDGNWTTNRNQIVSLYGDKSNDVGNRWFIGQPINDPINNTNRVYYDYRFRGIWQSADSLEAAKYGQLPGQIRVQDVNADGKINELDRVLLGNTYPKWTASLSSRVDWKRLDFAVMAITRQGVTVENQFRTDNSLLFGRYNNLKVDYWLPSNPSNSDPRPNADQEFPIYGGTRAYEDASFVRIRNITLGYTLPARLVERTGAESLRIYGTAQDPFLFTNFRGLDPEGRASAGSPSFRTLLIGASAAF